MIFLARFWTGRCLFVIRLNPLFILYMFLEFSQKRFTPRGHTDRQFKASGFSLLASQFVWELSALEGYTWMAPNKKETQTESFKRSLRRTLLSFWERGIFFCSVGFDWAQTVATITSSSQLSQPRPARHLLPCQPSLSRARIIFQYLSMHLRRFSLEFYSIL